jgi:hypothetical protein
MLNKTLNSLKFHAVLYNKDFDSNKTIYRPVADSLFLGA